MLFLRDLADPSSLSDSEDLETYIDERNALGSASWDRNATTNFMQPIISNTLTPTEVPNTASSPDKAQNTTKLSNTIPGFTRDNGHEANNIPGTYIRPLFFNLTETKQHLEPRTAQGVRQLPELPELQDSIGSPFQVDVDHRVVTASENRETLLNQQPSTRQLRKSRSNRPDFKEHNELLKIDAVNAESALAPSVDTNGTKISFSDLLEAERKIAERVSAVKSPVQLDKDSHWFMYIPWAIGHDRYKSPYPIGHSGGGILYTSIRGTYQWKARKTGRLHDAIGGLWLKMPAPAKALIVYQFDCWPEDLLMRDIIYELDRAKIVLQVAIRELGEISPRQLSTVWEEVAIALIGPDDKTFDRSKLAFRAFGMLPDWLLYAEQYPVDIINTDGSHYKHLMDTNDLPDDMNSTAATICEVSPARICKACGKTDRTISLWELKVHCKENDVRAHFANQPCCWIRMVKKNSGDRFALWCVNFRIV